MISREIAEHIIRRSTDSEDAWLRVIASAGGLDIAACETAGLAHDIGHPPFGHAGESAIDGLLRQNTVRDPSRQTTIEGISEPDPEEFDTDGFEGNAQTFRTVTRLDRLKGKAPFGLNLTNVALAAILKYPYVRRQPYEEKDNSKFGAYRSDEKLLVSVRASVLGFPEGAEDPGTQTLEASVMDLADDMAYAIHDLEDFLVAQLIDLAQVRAAIATALIDAGVDDATTEKFEQAAFSETSNASVFTLAAVRHKKKYSPLYQDQLYAEALYDVQQALELSGDPDTENYAVTLRMSLAKFVQFFFESIDVREEPAYAGGPRISLSAQAWHQMQVLKSVTRHFLVAKPRMGVLQRAQTKAIENLLLGVADWLCSGPERHNLPPSLIWTLECAETSAPTLPIERADLTPAHWRAIADYICTMSDSEALLRSQWLTGSEVPGSFRLALS